ncbi:M48 family metallopeptidase [bacterium SCSIO 12827]|nr:M48 family metallopeptidase [bacterium SCSIO 12827]
MSGFSSHILFGDQRIDFIIRRRDRKTLEIAVEPDMKVVVTASVDATSDAICEKVRKRAGWILKQRRYFSQFMPRTPERRFVSGETHLYLGRQYRLRVRAGSEHSVKIKRGFIEVFSARPKDSDLTRDLVTAWYHNRAQAKFGERIEVCLQRFPNPDAYRPGGLVIRDLRSRWASMSPASRLMVNRRLVQAPVDAIDYVLTHELCHIQEPHHGAAFFDLLERVMPDWQKRKLRLERAMS